MPCYTVVETTVNLGQCDRATLIEALKDLGWNPIDSYGQIRFTSEEHGSGVVRGEDVVMQNSDQETVCAVRNQIKRAFTNRAIQKTAQKFGWKVNVKGKNKITLKHS